jgi:hypothetical protein
VQVLAASAPVLIELFDASSVASLTPDNISSHALTAVLPLTIDDAHRASLLLASLSCIRSNGSATHSSLPRSLLSEVLVLVPDAQLAPMRTLFERSHSDGKDLCACAPADGSSRQQASDSASCSPSPPSFVPVHVMPESELIGWAQGQQSHTCGGGRAGTSCAHEPRSANKAWPPYALQV